MKNYFRHSLRILRKQNELTQAELAKKIGISRESIIRLESGEVDPQYKHICKILSRFPSTDANWLLLGEHKMYAKPIPKPNKK